ncbi:MAG: glycerol kinase GlpK [Oligoflexia bacterium]|nr:glycerol kinase GlpK [Oligoflexia bacterium]MBF0365559.1 glycerol kinase GlpK [Oligoflexia bacterium]
MSSKQTYILAIDQGTTGTTCALISGKDFSFIGKRTVEFPQHFPTPGEVEHNLDEIWESVRKAATLLLKKMEVKSNQITAIGITNQRETIAAIHKQSGKALGPAIVWQDRRTTNYCNQLISEGKDKLIKEKTGLTTDPYFSGTKIKWLLENRPEVKRALQENNALFGTIDAFLLYRLTSGEVFATDITNASRYLLMNIKSGEWDNELLSLFGIDPKTLPEIKDTFSSFGKTKGLDFLPDGIPITCLFGDQQSALFGQQGIEKGDIKCTYGTGAFMLMNTGSDLIYSNSGLLTTVAYRHQGKTAYALEGSSYIAGAAIQWMRDQLKVITTSAEIEVLAKSASSNEEMEHLLFLPFFSGIGSPYWFSHAKGAILGITRDTTRTHLARACLEGVALSVNDLMHAFAHDLKYPISAISVDGGASINNLLMEMQASISKTPITRPQVIETTAYGAALGAAIGIGALNFSDIKGYWKEDRTFRPSSNRELMSYYERKISMWKESIERLFLKKSLSTPAHSNS